MKCLLHILHGTRFFVNLSCHVFCSLLSYSVRLVFELLEMKEISCQRHLSYLMNKYFDVNPVLFFQEFSAQKPINFDKKSSAQWLQIFAFVSAFGNRSSFKSGAAPMNRQSPKNLSLILSGVWKMLVLCHKAKKDTNQVRVRAHTDAKRNSTSTVASSIQRFHAP